MSTRLFGAPLMSNYRDLLKDKYLAAYVAFDLYYAKLFNKDLSNTNIEKPEQSYHLFKMENRITKKMLAVFILKYEDKQKRKKLRWVGKESAVNDAIFIRF